MALGRYSRVDRSSSSSSYGSTVTIVVFVGLCLVGIWMMTSSSIIPDQNVDDVAEEKKYDLDDQVTPVNNNSNDTSNSPLINNNNDTSDSLQFDDNTGFLPEDPRNEESNESLDSDDGPVNLDESKKDKKQLDSEGGRTNGENLSEDAKQGDANASLAKDDGTSNLNTEENKDNTEENKLDESEKDKKHLASEGGWTNNNVGGNLPEDARKGNSNVSLAKDNGTGNSNSQENKENIERSESDEAKIDKKQLDSGGGQSNNSGENLPEDAMKGDSNVSLAKDDGTGNLYTQENKIPEVSNKEPVFNENVEKSGSGSSESEPDKSSSETNGGKVDQNDQKELFKTHGDKRDSERGQASNNNGNNLGALGFSKEKPDDRRSDPGGNNKKVVPSDKKSEKYDAGGGGKKPYDNSSEANRGKVDGQIEKVDQNDKKVLGKSSSEAKNDPQVENQSLNEGFSSVAQSELLSETITQNGSFSTQAAVSKNEKEAQVSSEYHWRLCNTTAGPDYIPCLDNWEAIRHLRTTIHYEHRERHCPQEPPTCLVPLPEGYKRPIKWPKSRERIWYRNVPHTQLAQLKGHQNWVKVSGEYLTFPGGGTQFKHGALHYIDFIEQSVPDIAWGKRSRVVLDVGCGVASFGGFLFDRNVLAMSVAPKDEHVAQVQLALERGIPAVSAVMGTKRLPYPGRVFDIVHCARCRVPWHIEGGKLLLELNRLLRPGGYFVWSAYPVYQKIPEDVEIWKAMAVLTKAMCWELVNKTGTDPVNRVAVAVFKKPTSNDCYNRRSNQLPPLCPESDDPNAAWNVSLKTCMHKVPVNASERGYKWPEQWPARLESTPYWFLSSQVGVYGKPAPEDFASDYRHWKRVVNFYLNRMGINWSSVRNVMDMEAVYGGFAAALKDLNLWVMNVVSIRSPDTLPIIYERGLFGTYHDWCESFSTYPRSYDILHADHLFSRLKKRCNIVPVVAEVDRILRPRGKLIIRDNVVTINELERMFRSLRWKIRTSYSKEKEGLLCVQKTMWRPKEAETITYAIA